MQISNSFKVAVPARVHGGLVPSAASPEPAVPNPSSNQLNSPLDLLSPPAPPEQSPPAPPEQSPPAHREQNPPVAKDWNWKAVGQAALQGAALGASSSTIGALGHGLRVPAAAVRYAGVATGAVVGTRTAERVFQNVKEGQNPLRDHQALQLPKAAALGAVGLVGGSVVGGLAGCLGGIAGATGGWAGILVATAAGAALSGGLEMVRQKHL